MHHLCDIGHLHSTWYGRIFTKRVSACFPLFFSVTRVAPPARPGSVTVNYIDVTGGLLEQPEICNSSRPNQHEVSSSGTTSQAGFDPSYIMIWGRYQVVYTVRECGNGMSLLQGFYQIGSQSTRVDIQRTAVGTPPVSGTFGLSFGNQRIHDIPFDVSASTLTTLLENNFVDDGGKHVCMHIYRYIL